MKASPPAPPSFSLRRRLLLWLLTTIMLAWAATAVLSFVDAHHEIDELFDAQLAQFAKVLLAQASHELEEHGLGGLEELAPPGEEVETLDDKAAHKYEQKIAFQIWGEGGALLLRSSSAPARRMSARTSGYSDSFIAGQQWRVFSYTRRDGKLQIQVGGPHDVRNELAAEIAWRLVVPFAVALPLLAVLIWVGVGRGLSPLRSIAGEVTRRDPQNLTAIEAGEMPEEIRPLAESLNRLLLRLDQALANERRFTADAAHELRTPLAALKTHAQVALRAGGAEERQRALEQVVEGVNRATHLVEQLLQLARLDAESARTRMQKIELRALAAECLAELAPQALARNIELTLAEDRARLTGDAVMLKVLVRNLVDNAIRYTPEGGAVAVAVATRDGRVLLEVTDTGPGISPEAQRRVMERFYRVPGSGESGSGLGLSIVQRIADLHGAQVRMEMPESGIGLRVRVEFERAGD
jgi:two-component system sensor histidine kinase QseC